MNDIIERISEKYKNNLYCKVHIRHRKPWNVYDIYTVEYEGVSGSMRYVRVRGDTIEELSDDEVIHMFEDGYRLN